MSSPLVLGLLVAGLCPTVHSLRGDMLDQENIIGGTMQQDTCGQPQISLQRSDFAFSLCKLLAFKNPSRNVTFSPLNVSIASAFLSLGAHSTTLTEILGGLKSNLTAVPEADIRWVFRHLPRSLHRPSCSLQPSVGNAMFMDEQLKPLGEFGMTGRQGDIRLRALPHRLPELHPC